MDEKIADTAKRHWKTFLPIWLFPLLCANIGFFVLKKGISPFMVAIVFLPLFFWSFFRTTGLWLRKEIKYSHWVSCAVIFPFLIWMLNIFLRL